MTSITHRMMNEALLRQRLEAESLLKEAFVGRDVRIDESMMKSGLIKAILGLRGAGKSFFAFQSVRGMRSAYLNFDDETLLRVDDYDLFLKALREIYGDFEILLLDEVQNLADWELFVNRLQRQGYNTIVTGSNSKLLGGELATALTGRHLPVSILPFSFREFLRAKGSEAVDGRDALNLLREYIAEGSFPEVIVKGMEAKTYLKTLFDSIVLKDVIKRHGVRFSSQLYDLARHMVNSYAREFSFTELKNALGFRSVHTVENYVEYLEGAFLIFSVRRLSWKLKEQMKQPKKVYCMDTGFINSLSFRTSENCGRLMENLVATELLRRSDLFSRFEVYYWRDSQQREVDFVLKEGAEIRQLIQVTYAMDEVRGREIRALLKGSDSLNCGDLLVITWDYEGEEEAEGKEIIFRPLWKWLLERG